MLLRRRSPVEIVSRTALHSPLPVGESWLPRSLAVSAIVHLAVVIAAVWWMKPAKEHEVEIVDIELAPPPPKAEALPAEVAKPPEPAEPVKDDTASAAAQQPPEPGESTGVDAGVDAPVDAARRDAQPMIAAADAGTDAAEVASTDAGPGDGGEVAIADAGARGDAAELAAMGSNAGSGAGSAIGSGSGVPAAVAMGSGSGSPGMDDQPAVDGAPTTAGTAANLLAYFPPGHVITALVRFDRLRGGEWAPAAERLFRPMPDYRALFGDRDAGIADKLDMLVISSPRPRDATATTLVMHTLQSRAAIRDLLANQGAPIAWSAAKGGMFGKRSGKLFPGDRRVLLSPWKGWYLLAQPDDLAGLTAPATGNVDAIEARGKLPPWLQTIRTIEKESGEDAKKGPALVVTLGGPVADTAPTKTGRYKLPDVGLGVTSLPVPQRVSLAMELVKQGWLVRGNIVFATEADAAEFVTTATDAQQRIVDSHVLSALLARQHALNIVKGLSLARTGARVSYGTSLSIADARAVLAAMAATLTDYFGQP
jgi:hypothetical protein